MGNPLAEELRAKFTPTKFIRILGLDEREADKLAWCAVTSGMSRIFWIDGYLVCVEVYDKAFEYEVERGFFPISQVCYSRFPNYTQIYDIGRGTQIPIADMSDVKIYQAILEEIKAYEGRKRGGS